jgi:hypothetical protein
MCEGEMREQTAVDTVPVECDRGSEVKLSGDIILCVKTLISSRGNIYLNIVL